MTEIDTVIISRGLYDRMKESERLYLELKQDEDNHVLCSTFRGNHWVEKRDNVLTALANEVNRLQKIEQDYNDLVRSMTPKK